MTDLIVFSDAGIDDIVAIRFLLKREGTIRAIVACSGNGSCARAYDVLAYFFPDSLVLLGAGDEGRSHAIHRSIDRVNIPTSKIRVHKSEHRGVFQAPYQAVCLAPCTELVDGLVDGNQPELITLMGGGYRVAGNETAFAEYNFHYDPLAASNILNSGIPIEIVPLDTTTSIRFDSSFARKVADPEIGSVLDGLSDHYYSLGDHHFPLHDLVACASIVLPQAFSYRRRFLQICSAGDAAGMLVADEHRYKRRSPNATIVLDAVESVLKFAFAQALFESP